MRASRSLSTRLASVGAAVALAATGFVGVTALVATAGPAGADTPIGTTTCNLSAPAGAVPITASVSAAISPTPVPAGNNFVITGLALNTTLIANATTSVAAGKSLSVVYTTTLLATGATPATQAVTFTGSVTLPNPFPVGAQQAFSLNGTTGPYTSAASGATQTTVSIDTGGSLSVALGALAFSGTCSGPPPVQIASAPITPAAGFIANVIPNAGDIAGGSTVKLVGAHFSGASAVKFGTMNATSFQVVSPTVITAVVPPTTIAGGGTERTDDITVTTAAGPSKVQPLDQFNYVDTTLGAIVTGVSPSIGGAAGGTQVTITGAGFAGKDGSLCSAPTSVSFGPTVLNPSNYTVASDHTIVATAPAGSGVVSVVVIGCDTVTPSPASPQDAYNYNPGYVLTGSDGGIFSYGQVPGNAGFFGSAGNLVLNAPVVGIATAPAGNGYWQAAADGGVFNYGASGFYGSAGNLTLNAPVVGIASTPDGAGYWLVAADGGVFSYGDALFYGSTGAQHLNAPVVGIASTPDGNGYWLVAADGGVFAYGDAAFHGSTGAQPLAAPMVGITPTNNGGGYLMVGADGGVFAFGNATFHGSLAATPIASPISGISATGDNGGYWLVSQNGAVFTKGDAGFFGDRAGFILNGPMAGMASIQGRLMPT